MPSKDEILDKIKILIVRQFDDPSEAFTYFDKDGDGKLDRSEIKTLLKEAQINRFLQGIVAEALISELDSSEDEELGWEEFESAIDKLIGDDADEVDA